MGPEADPAISVVVCSLNGARTIRGCLEALERQSVADVAEVVVVDDGSSDATAAIARSFGARVVVHEDNQGLSAARNSGIAASRAPVVAFTDDDCVPHAAWLERLLEAHERPGVVGVGGPVEVATVATLVHRYLEAHPPLAPLELDLAAHTSLAGRFALYLARMWRPAEGRDPRAVYSFPGANMSFKRAALEAVGRFNPRLRFGSDDEYVCDRVREAYPGASLWFEPGAVVGHDFVGTLADLYRRNFAYGRGQAQMFREDGDRRWPIVFPLPLLALACVLAGRRAGRPAAVAAAVQLCYPQGLLGALRRREVDRLAFSWLRLVEESAHNLGMLAGLLETPEGRDGGR